MCAQKTGKSWFIGILILGLTPMLGCEADNGIRKTSSGHLLIDGKFIFAKVTSGTDKTRLVSVQNIGSSTLRLSHFQKDLGPQFECQWLLRDPNGEATRQGQGNMPTHVHLMPESRLELSVKFRPTEKTPWDGALSFRTTSGLRSESQVRLPIEILDAIGELHVAPRRMSFGRLALGQGAQQNVTVTNIGTAPVQIEDILVFGSADYTYLINGKDPDMDPGILNDPDGDGIPGLGLDSEMVLTILFQPKIEQPSTAQLQILTDAENHKLVIHLSGNGAGQCLRTRPGSLHFDDTSTGATRRMTLRIESCGDAPLTLENITLLANGDVFRMTSRPGLPGILPAADFSLSHMPGIEVQVEFSPKQTGPQTGVIRIGSDDPAQPVLDVPILGNGIVNECPTAIVADSFMAVQPLDIVVLDGAASVDPDGSGEQPVHYEWVVIERPMGSTAQPVERIHDRYRPQNGGTLDSPATPLAEFFVDLAGDYVIALRVMDRHGAVAPSELCPQDVAQVTIRAVPTQRMHIQLVWNTPADADQTDEYGTDVDLHLQHPRGAAWFSRDGLNCFYQNRTPDWGRAHDLSDDPSLDIDDVDGAGPENINIENPEDTTEWSQPYRLGVHYFTAEMTGQNRVPEPVITEATVRIYLDGELAFESTQELGATDDFWEVAGLHLDASNWTIIPENRLIRISP